METFLTAAVLWRGRVMRAPATCSITYCCVIRGMVSTFSGRIARNPASRIYMGVNSPLHICLGCTTISGYRRTEPKNKNYRSVGLWLLEKGEDAFKLSRAELVGKSICFECVLKSVLSDAQWRPCSLQYVGSHRFGREKSFCEEEGVCLEQHWL